MTQINAYLNFDNQCKEAMTFYKECLGGDLAMQTIGDSPMGAACPEAMKGQILHATLHNNGIVLMGSDMKGPDGFAQGNSMSLALNCSSEEEINKFYSSLSTGGKIMEPLKEQFWGALFAAFTDKFGVRWMLNFDKKQKQ